MKDFKMFLSPHNGFSFVAYHVSWCQVTKAEIMKISQQLNMYISTTCSPSRSIAIGRNIYLESSILYNYFLL
jgi:hypothetical protein